MLACIRCGLCLTSCPTYVLTGNEAEGPRGRIAMMRALTEGYIELTPDLVHHEQNCLVCDACSAICPVGIHMGEMQVAFRSAVEPQLARTARKRWLRTVVFRRVFRDMKTFRRLAKLMRLYQRSGLRSIARGLGILRLFRLRGAEGLLPDIPRRFVVPRGEVYPSGAEGGAAMPVSFFAGCVMSTALAGIDEATIRVLRRAGCDVENTNGQGCCGALNAHAGDLEGALDLARRNIEAFDCDSGGPIVVNSAGCGAMLKEYAHHFREEPRWSEPARAFSARVKDVSEFLATRPLPMKHRLEATVTYQDPCHLAHAQRISRQPRELLNNIPGVELREMAESTLCCGSAGVYNVTNPDESKQLQQRKLDNALTTGAVVIATGNPGCLLQLRAGLAARNSDVQVKHVVELLDEAMAP